MGTSAKNTPVNTAGTSNEQTPAANTATEAGTKAAADVKTEADTMAEPDAKAEAEAKAAAEAKDQADAQGAMEQAKDIETNIFSFNGNQYTLSDKIDRLQVNGIVYTKEELITNKDVMTSLVIGNSPFVKKL